MTNISEFTHVCHSDWCRRVIFKKLSKADTTGLAGTFSAYQVNL